MQASHVSVLPGVASTTGHGHNGGRSSATAAVPLNIVASPKAVRAQSSTAHALSSLHKRTDSCASIASLLFDMEDEFGDQTPEKPARLPSELQQFADFACGSKRTAQAQLWLDALEARASTVHEQQRLEGLEGLVLQDDGNDAHLDGGLRGGHEEEGGPELLGSSADMMMARSSLTSAFAAAATQQQQQLVPSSQTQDDDGGASALQQDPVALLVGSRGLPGLSLQSVGSAWNPAPFSNVSAAAAVWDRAAAAATSASDGEDAQVVDMRRFAQHLADLGSHPVWVRSGLFTCPPESGMGTIRHKFVVVSMPTGDSAQPTYMVVDPNYKSHFQVAGRGVPEAEHYRKLLSLLPSVFVGTADQLAAMVNLLCKEMEKVFAARGVPLPPWRSPRVMQGRWLVNQVLEDEHVPATPPGTPLQPALMLQGGRTFSGELRERLPALAN